MTTPASNVPPLSPSDWVGRTEEHTDTVTAAPLAGLLATLDRVVGSAPATGTVLPPLAHWLYFLPHAAQRALGPDGHARRGGFLPPVSLPRRMWAGGRLTFASPLRVGDAVRRRSTISRVESKHGRSGALVFVTVVHEVRSERGLALTEEHDIVYRELAQPGVAGTPPPPSPAGEEFSRTIVPDPVLLFRYSALTFNGHRIHYDRTYAREVEGYPGLIVHGPLIATLLVDLMRRELPSATLRAFRFKAASALFDTQPFTVCGKRAADGGIVLWARNHLGQLAMDATAVID